MQKPSERSTGFNASPALHLVRAVIEGFKYHPYIFILRQFRSGDPVYPYAHQLELILNLFPRYPIRVLIGDEIGLGKTIEAIMIIKYLREIGHARRVLILVPRVLVEQWVGELKRFGFAYTEIRRIERDTIDGLRSQGFPEGVYIASIDLAKRSGYREHLLKIGWDAIVVDEAHRVGKVGGKETQRFELVSELAGKTPSIILLSATPHRGKVDDYIGRIKLVDPYLKAGEKELDTENFYRLINGVLVFRRTKLDVNEVYERRRVFTSCRFKAKTVKATEAELEFHRKLIKFLRSILIKYYTKVGEEPNALGLLLVLLAKRASSSPKAALITLNKIIGRRSGIIRSEEADPGKLDKEAKDIVNTLLGHSGFEEFGEALEDYGKADKADIDDILDSFAEKCSALLDSPDYIEVFKELHTLAKRIIRDKGDSRLNAVIKLVEEHLTNGDRVVIFTEFRDTAEYIFEALKNRLPEKLSRRVALVTSSNIIPPETVESKHREKYDIEDVKTWLSKGYVDVIVATDVASEGLNLQYANIVIHYEPTWSPIKIVQRIGRVWRLGQNRDVTSYTVLLTVESDLKALEVLYAKLLSWYISGVEKNVPIGEEVELEIDMLNKQRSSNIDLSVFVPLQDEKGERVQFSEYRAWLELIRGGEALEKYIKRILTMLKNLKKFAERVASGSSERSTKVREVLDNILGGVYGEEAMKVLQKLLISIARLKGYSIEIKEDKHYIRDPYGSDMPYIFRHNDISAIYEVIMKEVIERRGDEEKIYENPIVIAKIDSGYTEILLYRVEASIKERPFYSEVVGVARDKAGSIKIVKGVELLEIVAKAVENIVGVVHEATEPGIQLAQDRVRSNVADRLKRILVPFQEYLRKVEERFSSEHDRWEPRNISGELLIRPTYIGRIYTVASGSDGSAGSPPPIAIEEVEKRAMEIAMEYERKCGRDPEDVSMYEHYDIKSVDRRTGEVRYIEVKGRSGNYIRVELTETEFEYAKKLGDKYWLYIVYNIAGDPQIIAIRDPVRNVRWQEIGVKRFRMLG
ncbi:MAG: DUF3883 domain-containing protein [Sulfolobales archaeon]